MSNQKPPTFGRDGNSVLSALVDFGPDTAVSPASPVSVAPNNEVTNRILRIVKQLAEINKRIDDLASRF